MEGNDEHLASNLHIWNYGVNTCKQRMGGNDLLPVSFSSYWFITMYLGLIAIAPFLSLIAKNVNNNKQYRWLLVILFVMTFEYPFGRHFSGTHSLGLFVFLYLLSGYFRLYGIPSWLKLH